MSAGRVLSLSTSSTLQSVVLTVDGQVVAERERRFRRRQPRRLIEDLLGACADAGVELAELDRLIADVGPGTFTGIRAGLATARALAYAHQVAVVGVSSAALMWSQSCPDGQPALVAQPSRAGWCFVSIWGESGDSHAPPLIRELPIEQALEQLRPAQALVAPQSVIDAADAHPVVPCEGPHARWAVAAAANTAASPWHQLTPLYVGLSDAERNLGFRSVPSAIAADQRA